MITYVAIGLGILLAVSLFVNRNLLLKVEKYEDVTERQNNILSQLYTTITNSSQRLRQIDERGTFEADDEIGWFFDGVKEIQTNLENYIKEQNAQEEVQS
jgi:DNA repair exonuclease SbcCD nuclease subunit